IRHVVARYTSQVPLIRLRTALAALSNEELTALRTAVDNATQFSPAGLFAALDHVCDWEQLRRRGLDFALQDPRDAVPGEEMVASLFALYGLRAATDRPNVAALLYAIGATLLGPLPGAH